MQEPSYTYSTQGTGGDGVISVQPMARRRARKPVQQLCVEGRGATQHLVAASGQAAARRQREPERRCPHRLPGWLVCRWRPRACRVTTACASEGQALTRDTELTGHPVLRLWVSSTELTRTSSPTSKTSTLKAAPILVTDGRPRPACAVRRRPHDFLGLPWTRSLKKTTSPCSPACRWN